MNIPSPISKLESSLYRAKEITMHMKRDDLIDSEISGNKWRKLKYNVNKAKEMNKSALLTFGGAYSNHIAATAAAGKIFGLKTIGLIRGEEQVENHTLKLARKNGMEIHFLSRAEYRKKEEANFQAELARTWPEAFLIPEGGSNWEGVLGSSEIIKELSESYDYICCAAGTGTTAAGLLSAEKEAKILVFPALKGAEFLRDDILDKSKRPEASNLELVLDYHFGGYGKCNDELRKFYQVFKEDFGIELDLVYTAKMMYGIHEMIGKNYFPPASKILVLHTGGTQGNVSLL